MTQTHTELPTVPFLRTCPYRPPTEYAELTATNPVTKAKLYNGRTVWLVTSYAETRRLLADPRLSSDRMSPGYPLLVPAAEEGVNFRTLITTDPPEHTRLRRMVIGEFTLRRMKAMRPIIQRTADELVDTMLAKGGPLDLVRHFALPLPGIVVCHLLGVPYEDHEFFEDRSRRMISEDVTAEEAGQLHGELNQYLDQLVRNKTKDPGDDLLSRLAVERVRTGELSHEELVVLAVLLLAAGHTTTAHMLTLGALALIEHPSQLALLREDPSLMPGAVEELLRYLSTADLATARAVTADIEIGDQVMRAGDGVLMPNAAANWDPSVFENPDQLDIRRPARSHMAFGFGVHQCLGAHLGRIELEVAFETLFRRIPTLRLAVGLDELLPPGGALAPGLHKLPVTW